MAQTDMTQGLHPAERAAPLTHASCAQPELLPQRPWSQAPMQHSPAEVHGWPLVLQAVEHVPASQSIEQHSVFPPQGEPPGLHVVAHTPPLQMPEQQFEGPAHIAPSGEHAVVQVPLAQEPEQQSAGAWQTSPAFLHVAIAHWPWTHAPEQHDVPKSQIDPASRQDATHWPLWHCPEQHSPAAAHAPLALQPVPVDGPTCAVPAPPEPPPPKLICGSLLQPAKAAYDPKPKSRPEQARKKLTGGEVITRPVPRPHCRTVAEAVSPDRSRSSARGRGRWRTPRSVGRRTTYPSKIEGHRARPAFRTWA